eukprot:TRINITY_DN52091_c0_g1_i1.p1 TRINITY_DN52091_c0_g1~~TRINITY_DN52091_c0_g1_i1.p1  ORF type:complete len:114 (+),score=6.70 TRINITY_DN52091_c0_g1_i1:79-420(+)
MSEMPDPRMTPGQLVRIHSLTSRPQLNGTYGVLLKSTANGHWGVEVSSFGDKVAVRPENLHVSVPPSLAERHAVATCIAAPFKRHTLGWTGYARPHGLVLPPRSSSTLHCKHH